MILQDTQNSRWSVNELLAWLNDGQRVIARYVPESSTSRVSAVGLSEGAVQTLPSSAVDLLQVLSITINSVTKSVRRVERDSLDSINPAWINETSTTTPARGINYMYDERDPRRFYVYPVIPTGASANADIICTTSPGDATLTGAIALPDTYADALLDYILYRCFSKEEEEVPVDNTKATFHFRAFNAAIGQRFQAVEMLQNKGGAN